MENQVTTIEQSKRLLALGVPAEKAAMLWMQDEADGEQYISTPGSPDPFYGARMIAPAYTVADLLEMMPPYIEMDNDILSCFTWLRLGKGITKFEFRLKRLFPELWEVGG